MEIVMIRILVTGGSGFIGTNLIDVLLEKHIDFANIDINAPKKKSHDPYWEKCDILDLNSTLRIFEKFQPTHVIHLAARTDTLSNELDDYIVNTEGTANILQCLATTSSIQHVIITSSQFVYGPPGLPKHDEDFKPIGAYGRSKVINEQSTRSAKLNCAWTIIRPTNIWGPWHSRYPKEFWLVLKKGFYVHPAGKPVIRSYGYVGNIIYQLMKIIDSPLPLIDRRVYYLGDPPIKLIDWANGFSIALTGKPVRMVPWWLLKALAAAGSMLGILGIRFPIHLSRYHSMTEDYPSPMEPTEIAFGKPPYSLEEGIDETVKWLTMHWEGDSA
jgi:GlcNAc-P-P-Und epimerase